jgi:hypothetical protein
MLLFCENGIICFEAISIVNSVGMMSNLSKRLELLGKQLAIVVKIGLRTGLNIKKGIS